MTMPALDQVTGRIAQIESLLGIQRSGGALGGGAASAGSATSFSSALSDALGLGGAAGVTGTGAAGATGGAGLGQRAVALARGYTGVPYLWGGTDPGKGLDCSGLTQLVYGTLGIALPRVASDQARAGVAVPSLAQAQPGDLVFFGNPAHHVGIVAGDGMMIDAPHTGSSVGTHAISGYGPVSAIRRVVPATAPAAAAGATAASPLAAARSALLSAAGLSSLTALGSSTSGSDALSALAALPGVDPTTVRPAGAGAVQPDGGVPPDPETRRSVPRVTTAWEALQ